jgi:hypothetical protein
VLAGVALAAIDRLADVEAVPEKMGEGADAVGAATPDASARISLDLRHDLVASKLLGESPDRTAFEVEPEYGADCLRLLGHNDQLLVGSGVSERDWAADPYALALRGCDLVTDALANDLPLELGE